MLKKLKCMTMLLAIVLSAIVAGTSVRTDTAVRWMATSKTAMSITGDITVSDRAVTFGNGKRLPLAPVAERKGQWTPIPGILKGKIYKLSPPADPILLHGNSLCGVPATYVVRSQSSARALGMTVFTGANEPQGFGDHSCAVYFYER